MQQKRLTQTVTQMRIGAESTGQFLPGVFCIYVVWLTSLDKGTQPFVVCDG